MFKKIALALGSVLLAAGFGGTANATLLTDSVDCAVQSTTNWSCNPPTAVVGPGIETELIASNPAGTVNILSFEVDIGASSFSMTNVIGLNSSASNILTISSLNWTDFPSGTITGIANFFTDATAGIEEADVTTGPNSVMIEFGFSMWETGQVLSFDFVTTHGLPEPASIALLGFGMLGLGFSAGRVRRKRH